MDYKSKVKCAQNVEMISFAISLLMLMAAATAVLGQNMTNVKMALFRDNNWSINSNFIAANSSDFWRTYVLKAECETLVNFQEVFCLGKSVNITITDLGTEIVVSQLSIESDQNYSCATSNVENPDIAALDPKYAKGQVVLPTGLYSIKMDLLDQENVLGYRGYAVKASAPLNRLIVSSKCRSRHNPNK